MDANEGRDDWAEKEGHALQIALTLFHTAAKKKSQDVKLEVPHMKLWKTEINIFHPGPRSN